MLEKKKRNGELVSPVLDWAASTPADPYSLLLVSKTACKSDHLKFYRLEPSYLLKPSVILTLHIGLSYSVCFHSSIHHCRLFAVVHSLAELARPAFTLDFRSISEKSEPRQQESKLL